jgi:23S rRNA U2552 (ribose-2'-O)-methylase RlmE/FtsJ
MFRFKKKQLPEDVKYVRDIIHRYADKEAVKKLISPISDEYFIIDDENQIFICIEDDKVTISNHIFLYKKYFNLSVTSEFKKLVRESIENQMQEFKKSLFKNETELLQRVFEMADTEKTPTIIKPNFKEVKQAAKVSGSK